MKKQPIRKKYSFSRLELIHVVQNIIKCSPIENIVSSCKAGPPHADISGTYTFTLLRDLHQKIPSQKVPWQDLHHPIYNLHNPVEM